MLHHCGFFLVAAAWNELFPYPLWLCSRSTLFTLNHFRFLVSFVIFLLLSETTFLIKKGEISWPVSLLCVCVMNGVIFLLIMFLLSFLQSFGLCSIMHLCTLSFILLFTWCWMVFFFDLQLTSGIYGSNAMRPLFCRKWEEGCDNKRLVEINNRCVLFKQQGCASIFMQRWNLTK